MIEFTNVVKAYHTGNKALKGISMHINDGEFVFLVGPSGSGKSTIIKLITGEIQPTEGNVLATSLPDTVQWKRMQKHWHRITY